MKKTTSRKAVEKLDCFVDETGQDTKGKFFLVAIVLKERENLALLEKQLENIEKKSGKKRSKWRKTHYKSRKNYLLQIASARAFKNSIFYSVYQNTKDYTPLVSLSITKAILARKRDNYQVKIVIDGLNKRELERVRKELKKLRVRYRKIRGMKDEQSVFLRLADAIAGFVRDFFGKQAYTKPIMKEFRKRGVIIEV